MTKPNIFQPAGPPRYKHQRRALRKIIKTGGVCALLMSPGTGKTSTALDYMSLLALKNPERETRVLVVGPLAAIDTWVMQAETFVSKDVSFWAEALGGSILQKSTALAARGNLPFRALPGGKGKITPKPGTDPRAVFQEKSLLITSRGADGDPVDPKLGPDALEEDLPKLIIMVINKDSFSSRSMVGKSKTMADVVVDAVQRFKPHMAVVDESHVIKSPTGNASRALARLSPHIGRRLILTGTVFPHSVMDAFGQWRFLEPYAFGYTDSNGKKQPATFGRFRNTYGVEGGYMGKQITGFQNLDQLKDIMAINSVVVDKKEALDLPPTTDATVAVNLSPKESKAYSDMKKDLHVQLKDDSVSATNRLTQILRLRQVTSGFISEGGTTLDLGNSKAATINSLVNDSLVGEKRIVIFAFFKEEIKRLEKALTRKGTEVMTITGDTAGKDRLAMRKRFGSDEDQRMVMVAQIRTMSLAVNELVTANHAIFASLSQQRDDWVQARDRLDRIGQTRPVTYWNVVVKGTVDETILRSHRAGTDLEAELLNHIHEAS